MSVITNRAVLLVEPDFPYPNFKNRKKSYSFGKRQNIPYGLLKLATYYRKIKYKVQLVLGRVEKSEIHVQPEKILVTSLFTYWAHAVKETVEHYRNIFPYAHIVVGGVYASLMPEHCKNFTQCDEVFVGIHPEAEKCSPAYDLIETQESPLEYQVIWTSRGCPKNCSFCGVDKIHPEFISKRSIADEIVSRKLLFYDNNLLANPSINAILKELILLKSAKRIQWCEAQCGIDKYYLLKRPYLGKRLRKAGFRYPKIAWDGSFETEEEAVEQAIKILLKAGYEKRELAVFMVYNHECNFVEMEKKRKACYKWGIQINDCRFRPLDRSIDIYSPQSKKESLNDYYIHTESGWTDLKVRRFRKNVRLQNICLRHHFPFFSRPLVGKRYFNMRKLLYELPTWDKKEDLLLKYGFKVWKPG